MKPLFSYKKDLSPLLKLAVPMALTGIVQSSTYFFETIFLAHVSQDVLAASALVSWLFATIIVVLFGTLGSVNILVSHKHGANDQKGISFVFRDGVLLAILLVIPTIIICWNMSPIFLFFKQPASVVVLAQSYLHALAWGILPDFIIVALMELMIGLGHARLVMIFSFLSVGLTIGWSCVLIFGKFGFPAFGIAGAGYGTAISYWISLFALIIYLFSKKSYRIYLQNIFTFTKPFYLWELIKIGLPMGLMFCIEVGFFFAITLIMGSFSGELLAANQIAMQYLGLMMSIIFSIAQAITVRMGHLMGAREFVSAEKAAYLGVSLSGIFMSVIAVLYWFFPYMLISVDFNVHEAANFEITHFAA